MRRQRTVILALLGALAALAIVACTLNPQPLPPDAFGDENARDTDASADGGLGGNFPPAAPADAAPTSDKDGDADGDAGLEAGDSGDSGDGA